MKESITLGDIATIQTGPFGSQLHASDYVEDGIPVIMPTNIGAYLNIIDKDIAKISKENLYRLSKYQLYENDIIYSRRGDVEKCAFITHHQHNWLCGTGCLRVRFKEGNIVPKFFAYQLSTDEAKGWISGHAVGSTMPNLNSSILAQVPLLKPELNEQRAIASVLSSLDDKIDLLHRQNATLEAMAEALFKQWFEVDAKKEWNTTKLKDLFNIFIGRTPPRKEQACFSFLQGNKWVSIKDMGNTGIFINDSSEYLTDEAVDKFNIPIIPADTVILSFKMTVGRVKITTKPMYSNEAIACFIPKNSYLSKNFLYFFLKSYEYDSLGSTSSIVTAINSNIIKNIEIKLPPKDLIHKFTMVSDHLLNKIYYNQAQIKTLEKLRDTLLPKLMSGEVRVRY